VPRTNRGIFAINELPDLAERIQVGLLNVLEERDVQVRGYKIRLPLDVLLFASANPEDYTNRGRIITPLKDRFGAQIRTHYPLDVETEVEIARQETRPLEAEGVQVEIPAYMAEIVAQLSQLARQSPHINQRSGVSVRLTVSNVETLVANATRRALVHGESEVVPRVSDLDALASSTAGKVEIESIDEGRDEQVVEHLLKSAILTTFRDRLAIETLRPVIEAFEAQRVVHVGDDVLSADYQSLLEDIPALQAPVAALTEGNESPASVASAVEFVLEGLHLSKRLNKEAVGARAQYRGRA
jgi:magnesium chelatase subunit I